MREITLESTSRLIAPPYQEVVRDGVTLLIDPEGPNWISTDGRGAALMRLVDGQRVFSDLVADYGRLYHLDWAASWLHCYSFFQDALRRAFVSTQVIVQAPYPGRSEVLQLGTLSDLWLHVTNACNLSCEHCLVNSSPTGIPGNDTDFWLNAIDQARALGTSRFLITGGEPFLRDDIFEIIDHILDFPAKNSENEKQSELIILTNGMLFRGKHLQRLATIDPNRIQLQISLDGPTAEINNAIRGNGTFDATIHGIKEVVGLGFSPTLTTVVNRTNVKQVKDMVPLAASLGIKNIHLLLSHHRGRALDSDALESPNNAAVFEAFTEVKRLSDQAGITFDNYDAMLSKLMSRPGVKVDLSNAAYSSLCVYADGKVYPSAALAGVSELCLGNLSEGSLEDLWRAAPVAQKIRLATVQKKTDCKDCYLKYLCGGGDMEHSFLFSGLMMGPDPYSDFHEQWILSILFGLSRKKAAQKNPSGYDRPIIFTAMGEGAIEDAALEGPLSEGGFEVSLARSACVLSVDLDYSRRVVSDFYGDAADTPQPALCCPDSYSEEISGHIPQEVLDISYGCGSPVDLAGLQVGETMVDLGSGGGIDCFISAKQVGKTGQVVGIDMTDQMLREANQAKQKVVKNLGYDNVTFKKGYLEDIPLPDQFSDVVTSNCVINLSPDKKQVFVEIWRILKDFGRIVVSDTISEKPLPVGMTANPRLWGECVSGALTEAEYLSKLEQAGFYGLSVLKKSLWKEVEGYRFFSVVIRGYKFEKKPICNTVGQYATYLGPMQAVVDEEGHLFPRNEAVSVCTDTAAKLAKAPYQSSFVITKGAAIEVRVSATEDASCCEPEGCC